MSEALSRRAFLATATATAAGLGLGLAAATASAASNPSMKSNYPKLVHHVFFWLKRPDSKEDLQKLLEGLKTLEEIPSVRGVHLGVPAKTEKRAVIDDSYSASELLFFDDLAGQDAYQIHPIHQKFVETCSPLWSKVVVYDSVALSS